MKKLIDTAPSELYDTQQASTVSVILGENGSGKSYLLSDLAKKFLKEGRNVISIANTIYDKFPSQRKNGYSLLRARTGAKFASNAIREVIFNINKDSPVRLRSVARALSYMGYQGKIGIKINLGGLKTAREVRVLIDSLDVRPDKNYDEIERLVSIINRYSDSSGILWVGLEQDTLTELMHMDFINLLGHIKFLRSEKIVTSISYYLANSDETPIPLNSASSGELSLLASIAFVSSKIHEQTTILIDEPETSLHPRWQKEYLRRILDLFDYYQPTIIIATHSPLIVSGAEIASKSFVLYTAADNHLTKRISQPHNIEEMLVSDFSVVTPENRFISNMLVDLLHSLENSPQQLNDVLAKIKKLEELSYDPSQNKLFNGAAILARNIVEDR